MASQKFKSISSSGQDGINPTFSSPLPFSLSPPPGWPRSQVHFLHQAVRPCCRLIQVFIFRIVVMLIKFHMLDNTLTSPPSSVHQETRNPGRPQPPRSSSGRIGCAQPHCHHDRGPIVPVQRIDIQPSSRQKPPQSGITVGQAGPM